MRRLVVLGAVLSVLGGTSVPTLAQAAVVGGVGPMPAAVATGSAFVEAPLGGGLINFDDVQAPCSFDETVALRNVGDVKFKSPVGPYDGGAVLNECSDFGVTGYSSPNFLAFNCQGQLSDGGSPSLPEKIVFPGPATNVSVKVGDGNVPGTTLKLVAHGPQGKQKRSAVLQAELATVSFGVPVKKIRMNAGNVCEMVLDDLTFSLSPS